MKLYTSAVVSFSYIYLEKLQTPIHNMVFKTDDYII